MERKRHPREILILTLQTLFYAAIANSGILLAGRYLWLLLLVPMSLAANLLIGVGTGSAPSFRLKLCRHGTCCLIAFWGSLVASIPVQVWNIVRFYAENRFATLFAAVWCAVLLLILFWNGILCVYATSEQLGIRYRVLGLLLGWVPIAHLVMLSIIISVCAREVAEESFHILRNRARAQEQVCKTKYPVLLVHGVFFRDSRLRNYWGRIPKELTANGAEIYYGNHSSAASVEKSAEELKKRMIEIVTETGCEKVNLIAHSKGGLDCRLAIANGAEPYVASLTTVNTPHRGCLFADDLLNRIPAPVQQKVAAGYQFAAGRLGDPNPDFMAAVRDLTAERCRSFDCAYPAPASVYCQSVGSELKRAKGGRFPLNFSYRLVRHYEGANDGLVATDSFSFGERYIRLTPKYRRGISHGDMIDLNRENIRGFDVREFYVGLVSDLKSRGF